MYRQFHLQKKQLLNYTAIFGSFLFQMNRANSGNSIELILVGKCPLSVIRLQKRRNNLRSINLINGFGTRSYSICSIRLPIVLLTYLSIVYKLKDSSLYLKSGENNIICVLFTQYGAP